MSRPERKLASIAVKRFGLGARAGDIDLVAGDPRKFVASELDVPSAPQPHGLLPLTELYMQKFRWEGHLAAMTRQTPGAASAMMDDASLPPGILRHPEFRRYEEEVGARLALARAPVVGLLERLTWFWSNHFAVGLGKNGWIRIAAGAFERDAIRPHILGRFGDMLLASTRHFAMLTYLDNAISVGPNSEVAVKERQASGLNENLGREILELHTLGAGGGYGQQDVEALAKMLTGWTHVDPRSGGAGGQFIFKAIAHEPGAKKLLGKLYQENGEEETVAALADLARHPSTARFVASKFARHFIADEPPQSLVTTLTRSFQETGGDLRHLTQTLIGLEEAWTIPERKLRTPQEFLCAALRATGVTFQPDTINQFLRAMGNRFWDPPAPNGFPDVAAAWLSPANFKARFDTATEIAANYKGATAPKVLATEILGDDVSRETLTAIERAESPQQGLAILLMSNEFQRR